MYIVTIKIVSLARVRRRDKHACSTVKFYFCNPFFFSLPFISLSFFFLLPLSQQAAGRTFTASGSEARPSSRGAAEKRGAKKATREKGGRKK
jgi:hypothetical protein